MTAPTSASVAQAPGRQRPEAKGDRVILAVMLFALVRVDVLASPTAPLQMHTRAKLTEQQAREQ
jgi:hypothetical protein